METLNNITTSLLQVTVIAILIIGIWLIVVAGKTLVSAKAIRIQDIATIIVILSLILLAVAVYPAALMRSATNGINAMTDESPGFTQAVGKLINAVIEPWQSGNNDAPVTISQPTPQFTSTPLPMPTPSIDFNATATAYFGNFPTALPTESTATPRPMIEPTWTDYQWQTNGTPAPTVFICQTVDDIPRGCIVASPTPGN